ncbi:MAG: rhodanese-like domain-containing protein [Vicingus serpentipes]|nr:rhodanese-like domain-containing protein [Vicingus serpentipes]
MSCTTNLEIVEHIELTILFSYFCDEAKLKIQKKEVTNINNYDFNMKEIFFIILLAGSISIMGCSNTNKQKDTEHTTSISNNSPKQIDAKIENVDVEKFAALIEKGEGQVLDVRTPEEWSSGIIKGAIKINFYDQDFKSQISKLDKQKPVYVYCKAGGRSSEAAKQLQAEGFLQVYNLLGGITAWSAADKELYQ